MKEGTTKPVLDYSIPARWWHRRRAAVIAAILLITAPAIKWGPIIFHHTSYLWSQHRWKTYEFPRDTVIFESDPDAARQLLNAHRGHERAQYYGQLARTIQTAPQTVYLPVPKELIRSGIGFRGPGLAFLHERRAPSGKRAIVAVWFNPYSLYRGGEIDLEAGAFNEARAWPIGNPIRLVSGMYYNTHITNVTWVGLSQPESTYRVHAGQPDPSDESRFTIEYEQRTLRPEGVWKRVIEGRLANDGSVHLTDLKRTP